MTKLSKKQIIEKEIRKKKQQEDFDQKRILTAINYQQAKYTELWPERKKQWTNIILTLIYYGLLVTVKLSVFFILLVIKYYLSLF